MSGSFEDETGELNVPPTLISFAVAVGKAARAVSPEFKGLTHRVVRIAPATYGEDYRPDAQQLLAAFDAVEALTANGNALAISTPGYGCGAESLFKMCVATRSVSSLPRMWTWRASSPRSTVALSSSSPRMPSCPRSPTALSSSPWAPPSRLCHRHRLRGHRARRAPGGLGERHRGRLRLPQRRQDPRGRDHRLPRQGYPRVRRRKIAARA